MIACVGAPASYLILLQSGLVHLADALTVALPWVETNHINLRRRVSCGQTSAKCLLNSQHVVLENVAQLSGSLDPAWNTRSNNVRQQRSGRPTTRRQLTCHVLPPGWLPLPSAESSVTRS